MDSKLTAGRDGERGPADLARPAAGSLVKPGGAMTFEIIEGTGFGSLIREK